MMTTGTPDPSRRADSASGEQDSILFGTNDLKREADLRQQAVERMRYMNIQHAMHAWDHRYRDPIAPYGLAFLFAQPAPQRSWQTLSAATKLWLQGPESQDLPRLLFDLNNVVMREVNNPDFDVRRDMANRIDEKMQDDAWYIGLGLSSLDTHSGTWEQACTTVESHSDLPGLVRIVMIDSTMIVCDRRGLSDFNALSMRSTHSLTTSLLDSPYPWAGITAHELRGDPLHAPVLRWMEELNLNLWRADNARLAALHGGRS
jgi:hypothetical protein